MQDEEFEDHEDEIGHDDHDDHDHDHDHDHDEDDEDDAFDRRLDTNDPLSHHGEIEEDLAAALERAKELFSREGIGDDDDDEDEDEDEDEDVQGLGAIMGGSLGGLRRPARLLRKSLLRGSGLGSGVGAAANQQLQQLQQLQQRLRPRVLRLGSRIAGSRAGRAAVGAVGIVAERVAERIASSSLPTPAAVAAAASSAAASVGASLPAIVEGTLGEDAFSTVSEHCAKLLPFVPSAALECFGVDDEDSGVALIASFVVAAPALLLPVALLIALLAFEGGEGVVASRRPRQLIGRMDSLNCGTGGAVLDYEFADDVSHDDDLLMRMRTTMPRTTTTIWIKIVFRRSL